MKKKYACDDIKILPWFEHVRARPAMYVGSVDIKGANWLLSEFLSDLNNQVSRLYIYKDKNVIKIVTDLPLPTNEHPKFGLSLLEIYFTSIGTHPRKGFDWAFPILNALSKQLKVSTKHNDAIYEIGFENGRIVNPFNRRIADVNEPVTYLEFELDSTIFKDLVISDEFIGNLNCKYGK